VTNQIEGLEQAARRRRMSLTTSKRRYSKSEELLFRFLPQDGKRITSARLTELRQKAGGWKVKHPRNNITVTMGHLIEKVKENRERFVIHQSDRCGPHSVEYWIEVRR
jgi:hypothetical protein